MIPAEAVEAAAIAISGCGAADWEDNGPHTKSMIRRDARAALEAAAPHMFAAALQLADKWQPDFPYKAQELREALGVKHD